MQVDSCTQLLMLSCMTLLIAEKSAGPITDDNVCKVSAQLLYCCKKEEQKVRFKRFFFSYY